MSQSQSLQDTFWSTILERRSVRRYRQQPIATTLLEHLLTAAIWAPNAHNRQSWRFAVVTRHEIQLRMADAMARQWAMALRSQAVSAEVIERRTVSSITRISSAGALVVGCLSQSDIDLFDDDEHNRLEWVMATQSLALALGQLMLAAHHEGLGACWMCAPLFVPHIVQESLALPQDWQPQALITLGYAAETPLKTRKSLEDVILWR